MSQFTEKPFFSVAEILSSGPYSIPAYQRNFAWGMKEITQLIADVRDYAQRNAKSRVTDYYIGTLVVYGRSTEKQTYWEVVDGQQRLTTLSLLVSVLRGMHPEFAPSMQRMPLQFECREASSQALQAVFAAPLKPQVVTQAGTQKASVEDVSGAASIWQGRSIIEDLLRPMAEAERKEFADFLLQRVQLLRVDLPARTDLNHYFEVMNNRGEQLAKHEVLKARLLGRLQQLGESAAMQMLHAVWDSCAVMDRSVLSGFQPDLRKRLVRPDGAVLLPKDKTEMLDCFGTSVEPTSQTKSLLQLIGSGAQASGELKGKSKSVGAENDEDEESQAQFGAVINFPNFLLQVLALMPGADFATTSLDDKHLLTAFEPLLRGDAGQIQEFAFRLLRCRFLLDQHVVKSSVDSMGDEEHWRLQRCKFRNEKAVLQWVNAFEADEFGCAERLRMLQAALHVSYMLPTRKHWLQGALRWLYRQDVDKAIDVQAFLLALEELAKAFVLEEGSGTATYEAIVRREDRFFTAQMQDSALMKVLPKKLVYRQARLIDFNFLDYLLWLQGNSDNHANAQEWRQFEFTSSRRSVEHLHPQTELYAGSGWKEDHLHEFGNLCLVSHAMNSRLSNSGPQDKFNQLLSEKHSQSLKMFAMHGAFVEAKSWGCQTSQAMPQHMNKMLTLMNHAFMSAGLIEMSVVKAHQGVCAQ